MSSHIRSYQSGDATAVVTLWNQELIADTINLERFTRIVLADDNFDSDMFLLAFEGDVLIGFILGTIRKFPYMEKGLESDRAYINIMCVDQAYQRRGIGSALLAEFEKRVMHREIKVGPYSPSYFFPGVDVNHYPAALSFFDKMGYELGGEVVSMERNLATYTTPAVIVEKQKDLEARGYTFAAFQYDDAHELAEFLRIHFGGGWKYNLLQALRAHRALDTLYVCKDASQCIVGFVQRAIDGNEGRFGPFGVREDLRNLGLGGILFHHMMRSMVQRQIYHTYFLWTGGDAIRFYDRQGMQIYRTYRMIHKKGGTKND